MTEQLEKLQEKIGYTFKNNQLLIQALTHSSYINENNLNSSHNERMEFLGDAVLELQISNILYKKYPEAREGLLTSMRSGMVNEKNLAYIAREFGIGECLLLGKGEEKQGGRTRSALLADALEAIIGAVFLDSGYRNSQKLIALLFKNSIEKFSQKVQEKSYKTLLQEYTQANFHFTPSYKLVSESGPEHSKVFTVSYTDHNNHEIIGIGNSLKKAEHNAAKLALDYYGVR